MITPVVAGDDRQPQMSAVAAIRASTSLRLSGICRWAYDRQDPASEFRMPGVATLNAKDAASELQNGDVQNDGF